jgi:hypothetical protein
MSWKNPVRRPPKRWPRRSIELLDKTDRRLEALDRSEATATWPSVANQCQRQPRAGAT